MNETIVKTEKLTELKSLVTEIEKLDNLFPPDERAQRTYLTNKINELIKKL